jgi:EmrB/QacA subfamily drug resistance transporter
MRASAAPTAPPVTANEPPGAHNLSGRRFWLTIAGLQLALLLAALDQTIVGTAMPRIVGDLNGFEHYAWATTAYMLSSTAVVPIVGKLSDMYGRKVFLMGGAAFFVLTSVFCGLAHDMGQLALLRGAQGIGGGVLMSSVFTAISLLFPPAERGKMQGLFSAIFGLASILGPLLGGFLTDNFSWRWIFLVNVPVGGAALVVLGFTFPDWRPERKSHHIDYAGALTLVLGIVPLLLALTWGGRELAWTSPELAAMVGFGVALLGVFVWNERRSPEPIIPLALLRSRGIAAPVIALVFMSAGMFGTVLFVPLFMQGVVGASATESGTVLMPMMLAVVASSIFCGQAVSRTGRYKWAGLSGLGLSTAGLLLLSGMGPGTESATVVRNSLVVGLGMGLTMPVYALAAQNAVGLSQIGVATALSQFFRSIGGTMGVAVLGSLLVNSFATNLAHLLAPEASQQLPASFLAQLKNPQALLDPRGAQAFPAVPPDSRAVAEAALEAVRVALAGSLHEIFLAGACVTLAGLVVTLFLHETELRRGSPQPPRPARS